MPLVKVDKKGTWFKVQDFEGETHWVYSGLLTQKFRCLVIKSPQANIRVAPSGKAAQADYRVASKYESFLRVKKKGSWYQIKNDVGATGWVHSSAVWLPITRTKIKF